jgi:hypothetical protein
LFEYKHLLLHRDICGLYYKRIAIVIDAPIVASKWCSKLERHLLTIVIDDAS